MTLLLILLNPFNQPILNYIHFVVVEFYLDHCFYEVREHQHVLIVFVILRAPFEENGSITDPWDPLSFSTLPPSPLFQLLWDMITNNKGISVKIWEQFIGGDVPSIAF